MTGVLALVVGLAFGVTCAFSHPEGREKFDDGAIHEHSMLESGERLDLSAALTALDASSFDVISSGPSANVTFNLNNTGRGERDSAGSDN